MTMPIIEKSEVFAASLDAACFQDVCTSTASPLLREKRLEAFNAYSSLPMPGPRDEEWRRTDPAMFAYGQFSPLPALKTGSSVKPHELDALFDVIVTIDEAGLNILDRNGLIEKGDLVVTSLEDAAEKHSEIVKRHLNGPAIIQKDRKFVELNTAFWNVGLLIQVQAKKKIEKGILVRYNLTKPGTMLIPKIVIAAEEGSEATIVEVYESADDCPVFCIGARELYVAQAAHLHVFGLQEWGRSSYHIGEDWVQVGRDAQIDWVTLTLGTKASKMSVGCNVNAPNANAYMSGLFFADQDQHIDQRTLQQHSSPNTYSNLLYKGAVKDQGHSVYQGIIAASKGAIKVDAYQMNNNLVLNTGAKADSLPGLKIDADDLKCSHGSTMGNLDPDQMFYLRSRGFTEAEARKTLVLAFFEEVIAKIPYEFLQERIRADVNRKI